MNLGSSLKCGQEETYEAKFAKINAHDSFWRKSRAISDEKRFRPANVFREGPAYNKVVYIAYLSGVMKLSEAYKG